MQFVGGPCIAGNVIPLYWLSRAILAEGSQDRQMSHLHRYTIFGAMSAQKSNPLSKLSDVLTLEMQRAYRGIVQPHTRVEPRPQMGSQMGIW